MAVVLLINGVEQAYKAGTLSVHEVIHGRGVASLVVASSTGTYRPVKDQELIVTLNGTRIFGGLINEVTEAGVGGEPLIAIDNNVDCIDFNAYGDFRHVINGGFPAGFIFEDALNSLLGYLSGYGVTIDPAQVTGPALPLLQYDARTIDSIFREISQITGYIIEIDFSKVLRGYIPGTSAAPFNISDSNEYAIGDITTEPASTDGATTTVILQFGTGAQEIIDNFTGDGTTTAFPINYYPLTAHRGYVNVGGTVTDGVVTGGVNETFSIGGGGTWDYDPATGIVTRTSAVPNGVIVNFQYTAQFPISISDTTGGSPVRETLVRYPEIFNRETAEEILARELASLSSTAKRIRYSTYTTGLRTGMSQTIQSSKRNFNAACYIEELTTTHLEGEIFRYDVVAVEGNLLQNWWGDVYKEWRELGGGGSSAGSTGSVVIPPIGSGTPAPPNLSVQFNNGGVFGGSAPFTYNPTTHDLICGDACSITAALTESCQVFGFNNQITD